MMMKMMMIIVVMMMMMRITDNLFSGRVGSYQNRQQ